MSDEDKLKRTANLLRSGATMLFKHCPECGSPLFKKDENILCPNCNKKVIIVGVGEKIPDFSTSDLLSSVEKTILDKLQKNNNR